MSLFDVTRPEATSPMFLRAVRGINTPAGWPNAHGDLFGVITDQWHYIRYPDGKEELFAWRRDADERVNLADSASTHEVLDDLRRHVAGSPRAAKRPSR
jgi:hypothetical protein